MEGGVPRARFWARPEIAVIDLVPPSIEPLCRMWGAPPIAFQRRGYIGRFSSSSKNCRPAHDLARGFHQLRVAAVQRIVKAHQQIDGEGRPLPTVLPVRVGDGGDVGRSDWPARVARPKEVVEWRAGGQAAGTCFPARTSVLYEADCS
jgi:hypothetical protein